MKALRSFTVRPHLPAALAPLQELATNLRWSWDERTRDLFRWVDPETWELSFHDPVRLLGTTSRDRLEQLAADPTFMGFLDEIHGELQRYLEAPRWFQNRPAAALRAVAYFSPEFGLAEAVPQYSGGLGVLAGDHLKASSGLGVPLTGVGLFYRQGYFRQALNPEGWQEEHYPILDPHAMALTLVDGARVEVDLAGEPLAAQIWLAQVGRIPLYLLDADIDENHDELRAVTDRLYGGEVEHRLRQEILLGVGGVRALTAVGQDTQVFHTNEGHAGFLGLERIRRLVSDEGLAFPEALEAVRASTIFTTHTPVPAGTGVWVVKTQPACTASSASSKLRPSSTTWSRMRSRPRKPAWPSLEWNTWHGSPRASRARTPPMPRRISWRRRCSVLPPYRRSVTAFSSGPFSSTSASRR